jgi:PAS domain S-box-containing protein
MSIPEMNWSEQAVQCTAYSVIVADPQGLIRVWNKSAEVLFGYSETEMLGQSVQTIIPSNFQSVHSACYTKAMTAQRGYSRATESTVPARHRDGRTIQVRGNLTVLQDPIGRVTGAALIVRLVEDSA